MRIKKIELIGFKSFKDRTVIQFDAGITGIVGPNGCGKSNIVDALLWVMGEMSAKDLRGSSMVDVIFAGAEGFAPAGMAEVSLTLENDGGPFPVKYQKYSEIMVTRRLFRNGESEYAINKESARLRDIQEIFMDTGAGSKGFSIIQQGMIGRIITSKPEDRRMLIEEAAGITKFKVRKKESQRKLQATDQNLLRLADIVGELKRQIESLKRQSERAERYRTLKQQIEALDLKVASAQYQSIQDEVQKNQVKLLELQDQETTYETDISDRSSQVEVLKLQMSELESELDDKATYQSEQQSLVQKLELEIQRLQFDIEQAVTKGEMTGSMIQVQTLRFDTLNREREQFSQQVTQLAAEIELLENEFEQKNETYREQESRDQELDESLTVQRREMFALGQSESQVEARIQAGESQIEDIQSRLQDALALEVELSSKEQELQDRFESVLQNFNSQQELVSQNRELVNQLEVTKKELESRIEGAKKECENFYHELGQVSTKLGSLEELARNHEGFEEGVKQVMSWRKQHISQHADGQMDFYTLSDVLEVPSEYEVAMESALGHRLQLLLTPQTQDVLAAVDYLKQEQKGRASFALGSQTQSQSASPDLKEVTAILQDVVTYPDHLGATSKSLLQRIAVVDQLKQAIDLKNQFSDWTFVTLEGDVISEDGILTAGFGQAAGSGILKRRREIKELQLLKEEWSGKLALATAQLQKLEQQRQVAVSELELAIQSMVTQDKLLSDTRKDSDRAEIEVRNIKSTIERAEKERTRIQDQLQQAQLKNAELEAKRQQLAEQKESLQETIYELQTELESLRLGFSGLREHVTQLQVTLSQKRTQYQGAKQNFDRVQTEINQIEDELGRMNAETQRVGVSLNQNQILLEDKKHLFQNKARELENLRSEISLLRNQYEELSTQLQEQEDELHLLQAKSNQRLHQVNEAQIKFEQAKMREQVLVEQMRERYMLNLPDIWKQYQDFELDLVSTEGQLKDLKERLNKIGEVNLSAIEEYKQTSERYEFLVAQQNDLIEAKEQLRKVIDRINRICSKRFKDTFDLVNERFTKVFPVLFGGGEARLELVEDPEKSEVGIDIIAKPPGKKMQNISLLSGGEKALTAVSLVFAIFLVKPSPYCLLDEVDAPLDDANVSRFNDLVREMAKRSQLIVVTHNKHTMEIASKLYGVTMQNRGVSTMVSVNLNDL